MKKTASLRLLSSVAILLAALAPKAVHAVPLDLYVSDGHGVIYEYTPAGNQIVFAPVDNNSNNNPRGLTFDSAGNLFVATTSFVASNTRQGTVLKFNSAGTRTTFGSVPGDTMLEGVAINSAGTLFATGIDNTSATQVSTIFKFGPGGTPTVFGTTEQAFGLTFDSAGNLFVGSATTIYEFAPDGTRSIFAANVGGPDLGPADLAFDSAGNLFVSTEPFGTAFTNLGTIIEFPAGGGLETIFATGLNYPRGLAFDGAGNLFVTELLGGDILKFTPDGTPSVFASGLPGPEFLAFGPPSGSANVPEGGMTFILLGMSTFAVGYFRKIAKG